jgi:PEGA domain
VATRRPAAGAPSNLRKVTSFRNWEGTIRPSAPYPATVTRNGWASTLFHVVVATYPLLGVRAEDAMSVQVQTEPTRGLTQLADTDRNYAEAIERAVSEHQQGHFIEARAHFLLAHEQRPSARTLRGLGKVEFELRNYGEAVNYLELALTSTERALDSEMRRECELLLGRARLYVGEIHVDVVPISATVSVDGVVVARGPRVALSVMIGDHVLAFEAAGRVPARRVVQVRAGETTRLDVRLMTLDSLGVEPSRVAPTGAREEITVRRSRWWWAGSGALLVGVLAVSLGVGLSHRGNEPRVQPWPVSPNAPAGTTPGVGEGD